MPTPISNFRIKPGVDAPANIRSTSAIKTHLPVQQEHEMTEVELEPFSRMIRYINENRVEYRNSVQLIDSMPGSHYNENGYAFMVLGEMDIYNAKGESLTLSNQGELQAWMGYCMTTKQFDKVFSVNHDFKTFTENCESNFLEDYSNRYHTVMQQIDALDVSDMERRSIVYALDKAMEDCLSTPFMMLASSTYERQGFNLDTFAANYKAMADTYTKTFRIAYRESGGDLQASITKALASVETSDFSTDKSQSKLSYADTVRLWTTMSSLWPK